MVLNNYLILNNIVLKFYNKGVAEEEHGPALALSAGKLSSGCE